MHYAANDLIVAVNKLVEKLSTTKAALVSMTAKASAHSSVSSSKAKDLEQRLEQALAEAEDLKCQRASLEKRLEALKAANKINREELAATQTEVEELKSRCEGLQGDVTRERLAFERLQAKQQSEPVVSPEVQALEEENLELMKENKELMKQAASYRAQSERLTAQLAKAQVQTQVSTSTPALPATGPIRSALEAPDSSKKRTFGTDIAKCIGNSENISKESKESPSVVSKETGNASLLDVSASQHPEQKRSRVRAKAVVSTSSLTPSSGEAPCEAAPEEGCAQS